jgi:hypothetical protein
VPSQNRHGVSIAVATPTRGPTRIRSAGTRSPAYSRTGDAGSVRSTPFCARSTRSTDVRMAGPLASSPVPRAFGRRLRTTSSPKTTSPARSSTAPGRSSWVPTTLAQKCIP